MIKSKKKKKKCVKLIHLVTDDGLYDEKVFYKLKIVFIHSLWMMTNLSIINFLKEFTELNVNTDMMIKNSETSGIKYNYCDCFLEYGNFKDDLTEYKCLLCNKNCQWEFDE